MLGHPSIPRYRRAVRYDADDGDNVMGADNQQERLGSTGSEAANWFLAGFIEGEGALCVSVKKHPTCRSGFYVDPWISSCINTRAVVGFSSSRSRHSRVDRSIRNREVRKSWSTRSRPRGVLREKVVLSLNGTLCRSAVRGRRSSGSAKYSRRWSEASTASPRVWLKS
jgi:hypothetical protein